MDALSYILLFSGDKHVDEILDAYDLICDKLVKAASKTGETTDRSFRSIVANVIKNYPALGLAIDAARDGGGSQGRKLPQSVELAYRRRNYQPHEIEFINTAIGTVLEHGKRRAGRPTVDSPVLEPGHRSRKSLKPKAPQKVPDADVTQREAFTAQLASQGYSRIEINKRWKELLESTTSQPAKRGKAKAPPTVKIGKIRKSAKAAPKAPVIPTQLTRKSPAVASVPLKDKMAQLSLKAEEEQLDSFEEEDYDTHGEEDDEDFDDEDEEDDFDEEDDE